MSGHAHSHDHGHSHADHAHCQPGHPHRTLQPAVLGWAMVFTLSVVVAEVFGGIFGRSVALLNDAVITSPTFPLSASPTWQCAGPSAPPTAKKPMGIIAPARWLPSPMLLSWFSFPCGLVMKRSSVSAHPSRLWKRG